MALAKNVDDSGKIGVPRELASEFTKEDKQVVSLVTFKNISRPLNLRWTWITPKGQVYLATDNYRLTVDKGKYLSKVTSWHRISLKNEPAGDIQGQWSVHIFVDDELIDSKDFVVKDLIDPLMLPEEVGTLPKNLGLIIGIEDYNQMPKVEYARNDALIVRDYFIRVLGIPKENVITLLDMDATKARIEQYLKKDIPNNAGEDATLYVYYAGHGMAGTVKGEPYLMPYDADTRFIEKSGYKLISLYRDLQQLNLHRAYVFLEACFNAKAFPISAMSVKGDRPPLFNVEQDPAPSKSIIFLCAASANQTRNSFAEKRHGLFTYYLLRGIKGEADTDDDGWNSVKEVYDYIYSYVTHKSRGMGSMQTPVSVPPADQWKDVALSRSTK
ncbi:MAG: caspase family protein [Desulfobacteraceae bacterium]